MPSKLPPVFLTEDRYALVQAVTRRVGHEVVRLLKGRLLTGRRKQLLGLRRIVVDVLGHVAELVILRAGVQPPVVARPSRSEPGGVHRQAFGLQLLAVAE